MVTRFITDHGGYLSMGSNDSLAYRRVDISLPLPLVSRGRLTRVLLERLFLPSFLLYLALSFFLPFLPLHSPSTRRTTNRNGSLEFNRHSNILLFVAPKRQVFKTWYSHARGVVSGHQSTVWRAVRPNSICVESTTTDTSPVAVGLSSACHLLYTLWFTFTIP